MTISPDDWIGHRWPGYNRWTGTASTASPEEMHASANPRKYKSVIISAVGDVKVATSTDRYFEKDVYQSR